MMFQSFGYGVNSVALSEVIACERVFSDTGCEMPETYEYMEYYKKHKPVTILNPVVQGCTNLEEFCRKINLPPLIRYRNCTHKWKITPLERYMKKKAGKGVPFTINIGYAYDEKHRAKIFESGRITYRYPLVEQKIDRKQCIEIIKEAGLEIPVKSGCWFCPFQHKSEWYKLMKKHPKLFWKAVEIDEMNINIGLRPKGLRRMYPPPITFEEALDPTWECQYCMVLPPGSVSSRMEEKQ